MFPFYFKKHMFYNEKKAVEKISENKIKEISIAVEKTIEKMPLPDEEKARILEKSEKSEQLMQERYQELTNQNKKFDPEELYLQMIREMMMKVNWIDEESMSKLKDVYKKEGRIGRLTEINKKYFDEGEGRKKISKEAENFEDMTMMFVKYAEGGLISPQFFLKHLFSHLEGEALRKKRAELGSLPQQKNIENAKSGMDKIREKIEEKKYEAFSQMIQNRKDQYVVAKKNQTKENIMEGGAISTDKEALFQRLKSDPALSADLDKWINKTTEIHGGIDDLNDLHAGKTIRQAELSGLHHKIDF